MSVLLEDDVLAKLDIHNLISFLQYSPAWTEVPSKSGWQLFVSNRSITGVEIELAIPQTKDNHIFPTYAANAVDILSQLNNEQPDIVLERVKNVSKDVLLVRNIGNYDKDSIPLKLASTQISKLQTLIRQSSNAEKDALPYYHPNYYNNLADRMVTEFHFGHTQNRSFGLTIQSPDLPNPIRYRQRELFSGEFIEPDAPVARRIVERIIRGLVATKNAVQQNSVNDLVQYYTSGFSSNMCQAIVGISRDRTPSVEYSVMWSPKIPPPEDIGTEPSILLNETDYAYLSRAAQRLRELEPEDTVKVRGLVVGLSSSDDPHKFGVGQSIVIEWYKPDAGRAVKIIVDLKPDEYLQAIQAHDLWEPVEIMGEAKLMGNRWRLLNPRNFRVVPSGQ